jgi:thiaminase (transcriptional activator TenA)
MTTGDSFTHAIRAKAQPIWDCELKHPFVRGLGDGTLPIDRFRFYLAQDYVFLIEYCRVFALGAAKARDLQTIGVFTRLLDETLNTEMQLHRNYCQRIGIAETDCAGANHARLHAPSADGRVQRLDRGHRGGSASVSARLRGNRDCARVQRPRRRELELR